MARATLRPGICLSGAGHGSEIPEGGPNTARRQFSDRANVDQYGDLGSPDADGTRSAVPVFGELHQEGVGDCRHPAPQRVTTG